MSVVERHYAPLSRRLRMCFQKNIFQCQRIDCWRGSFPRSGGTTAPAPWAASEENMAAHASCPACGAYVARNRPSSTANVR